MNSQKQIIYVVKARCGIHNLYYINKDKKIANSTYDKFQERSYHSTIKERILSFDEYIASDMYGRDCIMKTIEWKKNNHNPYFKRDLKFVKQIRTLLILHLIGNNNISSLPHDIIYYLFSFLEGGIIIRDTTEN